MRTHTPPSEIRPAWPASTLKAATWRWSHLLTETWPSAPALAQPWPLPAGTSMTWVSLMYADAYLLLIWSVQLSHFGLFKHNIVINTMLLVWCCHKETFSFTFSLMRKTVLCNSYGKDIFWDFAFFFFFFAESLISTIYMLPCVIHK